VGRLCSECASLLGGWARQPGGFGLPLAGGLGPLPWMPVLLVLELGSPCNDQLAAGTDELVGEFGFASSSRWGRPRCVKMGRANSPKTRSEAVARVGTRRAIDLPPAIMPDALSAGLLFSGLHMAPRGAEPP
jgi:hypothetical protein